MAIITLTVLAVVALLSLTKRILVWRGRNKWIRENGEYLQQVQEMDSTYCPEKPDIELSQKCKDYLSDTFPDGVKEKLRDMSKEERTDFFRMIEKKAEEIMEVHVDIVDFYQTDEKPDCYYCGSYSHEDNSFRINANFIVCDDLDLVEEQIYTIFHELKHARQWSAVLGERDYGYSKEQLLLWAENFNTYIPPVISDELYRKQPVEMDTFGFESILKGEYKSETA